jgi:SAM-dependent methyltransferase
VAFEELKRRQSEIWGSGSFEAVADHLAPMHDELVARLEPAPGLLWLDLACGTGQVARRAARAGATVVASDLAPPLLETARRLSAEEGLSIEYGVVDCEATPYPDASFDVVSSSVGVILSPDQRASARELARICRPGGRVGLTAWRGETGVGDYFRALAPFSPPPPEGAGDIFDWGREDHVHELLGDAFELTMTEHDCPRIGPSGEELWAEYTTHLGPAKVLAESLDPSRRAELDRTMAAFFERFRTGDVIRHSRPYLLILGTRR